jgi:hypothetical protein
MLIRLHRPRALCAGADTRRMRGTSRGARAQAINAAVSSKRAISRSVARVGFISLSVSPISSAAVGRSQRCPTISVPSWATPWPSGAAATKNRVSKRLARPGGVSQCAR